MDKRRRAGFLVCFVFCLSLVFSACGTNAPVSPSDGALSSAQGNAAGAGQSPGAQPGASPSPSPSPPVIPTSQPSAESPTPPRPLPSPSPTPAPSQAAPQSIELVNLTSPVQPGNTASITIKGKPNTTYSITVRYKSGASTAAGLSDKKSDSSGRASWSWKVGTRTTSGSWPISINGGGQSKTFNFNVT